MSTAYGLPCEACGRAPLLRFTTDGNGRHQEVVIERCACSVNEERQRLRVCRVCEASIADLRITAVYCGPVCAREGRLEHGRQYTRAYRAKNLKKVRAHDKKYRRKKRASDPVGEREKERRREPRYRERDRALKRAQRRWGHPKYEENLAKRRDYYARNRETILGHQRAARARKRAEREAMRQDRAA